MNRSTEASDHEGRQPAGDPLASRTLAALYATQGHPELAERIFRQIGPAAGSAPLDPGRLPGPQEQEAVLNALVAFREGARRARAAGPRRT